MNSMNKVSDKVSSLRGVAHGNRTTMIRALEREITCLERQVTRIRIHNESLNDKTIKTYEEMIDARKSLLYGL